MNFKEYTFTLALFSSYVDPGTFEILFFLSMNEFIEALSVTPIKAPLLVEASSSTYFNWDIKGQNFVIFRPEYIEQDLFNFFPSM